MTNIDNCIMSLIQAGKSIEDIGRELSCALNRAQKAFDEAERKARKLEEHRAGLIDNINAAVDINSFDPKAAVSATVVALIDMGAVDSAERAEAVFTNLLKSFRVQPEVSANKREEEQAEKKVSTKYYNQDDMETLRRFLRQVGL